MITSVEVKQGIISKYLSPAIHGYKVGAVHSVFKTSFNLSVGHFLMHFNSTEKPLSAFGVNIPPDILKELLSFIKAGDMVRIKDNILTIYAGGSRLVSVKFQQFIYKDFILKEHFDNIPILWESPLITAINLIDFEKNMGLPYGKTEIEWIGKLKDNKNRCNSDWIEEFVKYFIGRGKGLTPSGDDFIIGFIMMLYIFRKEEFLHWRLVLQEQLKRIKTTDVSYYYYQAMFEGYTSQQFYEFSQNLFYDVDSYKVQNIINNILSYGSSSGYDTLFGIYTALFQIIFEEDNL